MKKLISILGLSLGIGLSSLNAQDLTLREKLLYHIDKDNSFSKCYLDEWVSGTPHYSRNNKEYIITPYNFDKDSFPDLIACFRPGYDSTRCRPFATEEMAEIIMMDDDGDGTFDYSYIDIDKDGYFDFIEEIPGPEEKLITPYFLPNENLREDDYEIVDDNISRI